MLTFSRNATLGLAALLGTALVATTPGIARADDDHRGGHEQHERNEHHGDRDNRGQWRRGGDHDQWRGNYHNGRHFDSRWGRGGGRQYWNGRPYTRPYYGRGYNYDYVQPGYIGPTYAPPGPGVTFQFGF